MTPNEERAVAALEDCRAVALSSHVNPDGDAVGSMLALGLALEARGKQVSWFLQDPVPSGCTILAGADRIVPPPATGSFDTAIVVDCEGLERAGSVADIIRTAPRLLTFDHHPSSTSFGDIEVRDTSAAATGEILHRVMVAGGYAITPDIADCLMAALLIDTGCFRFSSVTPGTLQTAADLVGRGARIPWLYRELYENRSLSRTKLMGAALSGVQLSASGRVAYATVTRADFDAAAASDNETDGIVNELLALRDVKAAVLLRESMDGIRISLRSREAIDVNQVARAFGGGGHVRAAGCTIRAPIKIAIEHVLSEIDRQTTENGQPERPRP